jgi:predicted GNAT superfamily acetyltransferase
MKTSRQKTHKEEPAMVRTSLALPEDLWKETQHRAIETRTSLRQIIIEALTAYLKTPSKR